MLEDLICLCLEDGAACKALLAGLPLEVFLFVDSIVNKMRLLLWYIYLGPAHVANGIMPITVHITAFSVLKCGGIFL